MLTVNLGYQRSICAQPRRGPRVALTIVLLVLCTACSDRDIARISAKYALDLGKSESSAALRVSDVSLALASDGTFVLTGEFDGDDRSYEGQWSLNGNHIEFSGGPEFESASATVKQDHLLVVGLPMLGNLRREFVRDEWPGWSISIFALAMLVFAWMLYAKKDSINVTFSGGSPEFVIGIMTVSLLLMMISGLVGSFKPEVLVWAGEAEDRISVLEYLGFLGLVVIGILAMAYEEEGVTRILWVVFGLPGVALLVWLYFEYGVEIEITRG